MGRILYKGLSRRDGCSLDFAASRNLNFKLDEFAKSSFAISAAKSCLHNNSKTPDIRWRFVSCGGTQLLSGYAGEQHQWLIVSLSRVPYLYMRVQNLRETNSTVSELLYFNVFIKCIVSFSISGDQVR